MGGIQGHGRKAAKAVIPLANVVSNCGQAITGAVAEGINSKIMGIKRRLNGYRKMQHFKNAIYFYCGGLCLYP